MKLTKRKAVEESIKIWKWLAETGKEKEDYAEEVDTGILDYESECPLCEFEDRDCEGCVLDSPDCYSYKSMFQHWLWAVQVRTKKKYATKLLEILTNFHAKTYKNSPYKVKG